MLSASRKQYFSAKVILSPVSCLCGNMWWDRQVECIQSRTHMLLSFIWQILSFTGISRIQGFSTKARMETGCFVKTEKLQHFVKQKQLAQKVK